MSVHVFDAYGTLLDVSAPLKHLAPRLGPKVDDIARLTRQKQLEYTWVRTLGHFPWRDFEALTTEAFVFATSALGVPADAALIADFVALYRRCDAYPDVAPMLTRLAGAGGRLGVLTNGSQAMIDAALTAAGIAARFEAALSIDPLQRFKTEPDVYALVTKRFGVNPGDVTFYSSNRWDAAAATRFGFATVWVNRTGAPDEYRDLPPGRVVTSLAEI